MELSALLLLRLRFRFHGLIPHHISIFHDRTGGLAQLRVMNKWVERPYLFIFPVTGVVAAILLAASLQRRSDQAPFRIVAVILAAAFGTLALSFWPYMVPSSITIEEAATPHSSLAFMFWGAGLPDADQYR